MTRKTILVLAALITVFAMMLTGCGAKDTAETTEAPEILGSALGRASWEMSATTWSSPNGATVHVSAVPTAVVDGQYAVFSVRLEGEDVQNIPCTWDGTHYTASADLNAADGYCYYLIMTSVDGKQEETVLNTPAAPRDESLINLESSLNSYCHLLVESSDSDGKKLTITGGTVQIQPPQIANEGEKITCSEAVLVLNFNGQEADRKALTLGEPGAGGVYAMSLEDIRFDIPEMEDDQQLSLRLDVTLSNGQVLTDSNGTWSYIGGELVSAVG